MAINSAINIERQTFSTANRFSYAMVYNLNLNLNLIQSLLLTHKITRYTRNFLYSRADFSFYYTEFFKNHYIPQLIIKYKLNKYNMAINI